MINYKKISDFPNYSISETGQIWNNKYNRPLVSYLNKQGYLEVELWSNNIGKNKLVHRLVAQAFIPNPENKPQVHHKDDDRRNCNVDNLKWGDNFENCQQRISKPGKGKISKVKIMKLYKSKQFNDIDDFVRKIISL